MEPPISGLQIESQVHELLDFPCSHDYTGELNNDKGKPYNCPYSGSKCTVTGDVQWLLQHLKNDHHVEMHDGRSFSHRYVHHNPKHLHHATWMLTLLDCYGRQFCLYFEAFHLKKTPMYMAFMQFMGDEEEATSFSYTLEVNGDGRKMTWQGVPRSIRDSHKTVRDSQDGLIITRKLALFFSTDNTNGKELKLKISGRVWREH
ncbi:inactive E3 ubiquitin-protein ligase SINAT6 [Hirschfeldia incana]|nr:inactive E3 ubiquitin-protein ligase SINAT6 [Hirschfeldia incana]